MSRKPAKPLILIGPMGAGKSTIGRCLAAGLGVQVLDVDEKIEEFSGKSIPALFREDGEEYFRRLETQALRYCLDCAELIATGGGIVGSACNLRLLRQGFVIYLYAPLRVQYQRTASGAAGRPMLSGGERLQRLTELFAKRHPLYTQAADMTLDTSRMLARECAMQLIAMLSARRILQETDDERN